MKKGKAGGTKALHCGLSSTGVTVWEGEKSQHTGSPCIWKHTGLGDALCIILNHELQWEGKSGGMGNWLLKNEVG